MSDDKSKKFSKDTKVKVYMNDKQNHDIKPEFLSTFCEDQSERDKVNEMDSEVSVNVFISKLNKRRLSRLA